ncbi:DUF1573 domain-containing protein, partial [Roseimaritima sediminicola]|uniref:DUF1573 domain-containing protein n=1 Tax=Roseimaritima sediminicola TaxID=2662066 RepID=UPI0012983670
ACVVLASVSFAVILATHESDVRALDVELGVVDAESQIKAKLLVTNDTDEDRKILGMKPGCPCVVSDAFPLTIGAGSTAEINLRINTPEAGKAIEVPVLLYTDSPGIGHQTSWIRGLAK